MKTDRWTKGAVLLGCLVMAGMVSGARYSIKLSDDAKPWERAAADLDKYLKLRLGGNLLTVEGNGSVAFHVGETSFAERNGLPSSRMDEEAWCVRSVGAGVIVNGGGTRGVRYAASRFLEDCCGARSSSSFPDASRRAADGRRPVTSTSIRWRSRA